MLVIISLAAGYAAFAGGAFGAKSQAFASPITGLTLPGVSSSIPTTDQATLRPPAINKTLRASARVVPQGEEVAAELAAIRATPTAEPPPPAEDAVVRAANVAPLPPEKPYSVYKVQSGDTISSIAAAKRLSVETLTDNNVEIQADSNLLTLGQSLIIPADNGVVHEIRLGDTLIDIAARYNVEVAAITGFTANGITTADDIKEARYVFVPGGKMPARAPVASPLPTPDIASVTVGGAADASDGSSASASAGIVAGGASSDRGLIWPVVGPISSPYGSSHPLGIDIDGYRLAGAPVAAATSGVVVFAGGNACCSYGLYVVVMSPGGIETLYAHLSSIVVSQGQTVSQGEELGVIGSTGYSTGTHLHLEVIDNGTRENPAAYLP